MIAQKKDKIHAGYAHLRSAPLPVVITRGDGLLIEYANERALLLTTNQDAESIVGNTLSLAFPEIFSLDQISNIRQTCFLDKKRHAIEEKQFVLSRDDKTETLWFDIETQPIEDADGNVEGTITFFTSVNDRVIARKSIDQREEFLGNFFKKAPVGVVCYRGEEFIVDLANDKALEMWGKTWGDVKGKPIREIFPQVYSDETIRRRHNESIERLKKGETHIVHEVELVFSRNGVPHTGWYTYIHEPYTNSAGETIGMMAVAIEVTEQVMARQKLQLITDALPSLVSYINRNEEYEFVNKAYEVWFGHSRNDIIGKSLQDVLGIEAYKNLRQHVENVFSGKSDSFEHWVDYKEGGKKYISANYVPHIDEANNVKGFFALVNDLTERKKSEESVRASEERLRLITDGISAGTFEYDTSTEILVLSKQIRKLLGLSEDALIDPQTAMSVVHRHDLSKLLERFGELQSPKEFIALDYRIVRPDNRAVRWMHTRAKVLFRETNGKQEPVKVIGFTIDITEQKEREEQLREFNTGLESEVKKRTLELHKVNRKLGVRNQELTNSQSFLKQLVDSSVEIIGVVDKELRYTLVNKAFEERLQMGLADVIGKHAAEVFPVLQGTVELENMQRALRGEVINVTNHEAIERPGMFVDTNYIPLKFGDTIEGVIIMARDVSSIVSTEKALENLNRQLKDAQQLSKLGSWEWDISTGAVLWSDEMYRIYGYTEKFPVDFKKATELMTPEDAERSRSRTQQHLAKALDNYRKTGALIFEMSSIEFPIHLPNGQEKILRSSGKIELTPDGKLHRILGAIQDVTETRAAERTLHEKNKLLELRNRELESFTYAASHDLQEPLRKILTYADRILQGDDEKTLDTYVRKIDYSAQRMRDLIRSMLQYGRLSKIDDPFEEVDLNAVLKNMETDFELLMNEKGAVIQSDLLPTLKASAYQMNQLFFNLIGNSLKFCNDKPVITITSQKVAGSELQREEVDSSGMYWNLVFTDNGIGFDPSYKDQIFELFQRLHAATEFSGTGIGLSIVKRIIERHQGFIEAFSEPGRGARFSIWLPCD